MTDIPHASIRELAHKVKAYGVPRFAFLLGAGASRQSGIPTAGEMIRHFKEQIVAQCGPEELKTDDDKRGWIEGQEWYKADGSEYCKCFEKYEPKEIGRQRYIESVVEKRDPSFGYVVLANLMASGHINTIITTNFDDLVYSACTTFTGIRPIVYAYGVMASEMRLTAQRPKILKLHGDYLYSALKNTGSELAAQDPNMVRQLRQVLSEYGLIVVGYGGGDKSVMEVISDISERNDLYWCVRRGESPNPEVKKLLRDKRGFLVEIEGFDEMMNEVRRVVEFDVKRMLGSIEERRNQIIKLLETFERKYSADILGDIVDAVKQTPKDGAVEEKVITALDYVVKGHKAFEANDFNLAEELYRENIGIDPNYAVAFSSLGNVLYRLKRNAEAEPVFRKAIELNPGYAYNYSGLGNVLSKLERYEEAEAAQRKGIELDASDPYCRVGLGDALLGLKRYDEAEEPFNKAIELSPNLAYGYCGRGIVRFERMRYEEAEAEFRKAIELDPAYSTAYFQLGNTLRNLGRPEEAEAAYRSAVDFDPEYAAAYTNLSNLLRLRGKEAEALRYAEKAIGLDAGNPLRLLSLAAIHKKLGDDAEARRNAAEARGLLEAGDWYNLACLESISGNTDAAIENLRRAAEQPAFEFEWARRDPDFEWIRDDPRFREIVGAGDAQQP